MKERGQGGGTAVIWGAGALLLFFGTLLFLESINQNRASFGNLAFLEAFVSVCLLIFGVISLYMAHK